METVNNFIYDMFYRIVNEATLLRRTTNHKTLSQRDINSAVKLVLPRNLAKHATIEANNALMFYHRNSMKGLESQNTSRTI